MFKNHIPFRERRKTEKNSCFTLQDRLFCRTIMTISCPHFDYFML